MNNETKSGMQEQCRKAAPFKRSIKEEVFRNWLYRNKKSSYPADYGLSARDIGVWCKLVQCEEWENFSSDEMSSSHAETDEFRADVPEPPRVVITEGEWVRLLLGTVTVVLP